MKLRSISKQQLSEEPFIFWNSFVDLLAMEDYDNLNAEQRPASLVFSYKSEVENGGHFQYFENRGTERLLETIKALELLGAECQKMILKEAGEQWTGVYRMHPESVEEYVEIALEEELKEFDVRYHECETSIDSLLEKHLDKFGENFIDIV